MWLLKKIWALCLFPIEWFFQKFEELKEENATGKIILLFLVSLTGFALFAFVIAWIIATLIVDFPEALVIIGLIIWLYVYVKEKMFPEPKEVPVSQMAIIQTDADKSFPVVRNIVYQTLKEMADCIGGVIPRTLDEITFPECHYLISHGVSFYQYRLNKSDIKVMYTANELQEFKRTLQNCISNKIQAGQFPMFETAILYDKHGNAWDAVCVERIEDVGNYFSLQVALFRPAYAEYAIQMKLNEQANTSGSSIPDAHWGNK